MFFLTWIFFSMNGVIEIFGVWVKILEYAGILFYLFESFKWTRCARTVYYTLLPSYKKLAVFSQFDLSHFYDVIIFFKQTKKNSFKMATRQKFLLMEKKSLMWRKISPRLKPRWMKCMTTKSTPNLSMIVSQNYKTRYWRWEIGLVETTYESME